MTGGRTTWSARDGAHHDRELVVELLDEFGPAGPYVDVVLRDLAQQQRDGGTLVTGFRVLGKKTGVDPAQVRAIVELGAQIGLFDDLTIAEDGRRFTCRISGWEADQARGKSAWKKADQRARAAEDAQGQDGDVSTAQVDVSTAEGDMSTAGSPTRDNQRSSSLRSEDAPVVKYDRKVVPQPVVISAQHVLAVFNRRAGTNYRPFSDNGKPSENLKRILGAMIRDQRLTGEVAERMISAALADPKPFWGNTTPHLGHVFGPGVVEGNLEQAVTAGKPNGLSAGDRMVLASRERSAKADQAPSVA